MPEELGADRYFNPSASSFAKQMITAKDPCLLSRTADLEARPVPNSNPGVSRRSCQASDRRRRVAAARVAAERRRAGPFVLAACLADARRDDAERLRALLRACRASAFFEAAA